jgi:hypothetical protein
MLSGIYRWLLHSIATYRFLPLISQRYDFFYFKVLLQLLLLLYTY